MYCLLTSVRCCEQLESRINEMRGREKIVIAHEIQTRRATATGKQIANIFKFKETYVLARARRTHTHTMNAHIALFFCYYLVYLSTRTQIYILNNNVRGQMKRFAVTIDIQWIDMVRLEENFSSASNKCKWARVSTNCVYTQKETETESQQQQPQIAEK